MEVLKRSINHESWLMGFRGSGKRSINHASWVMGFLGSEFVGKSDPQTAGQIGEANMCWPGQLASWPASFGGGPGLRWGRHICFPHLAINHDSWLMDCLPDPRNPINHDSWLMDRFITSINHPLFLSLPNGSISNITGS